MRSRTGWTIFLAVSLLGTLAGTVWARGAITIEEGRVEVLGLSLHYERYAPAEPGPAAAGLAAPPPVLLLHGLGASAHTWFTVAPELAGAGFTVYALDFPGFGDSEVPPAKVSVLELPRYVAAFLKEARVERVSAVGNSMGGYVAWLLAADHPALVERLVLVDAAGLPLPDPLPPELRRLRPWYLGLPGAELIGANLERLLASPGIDDLTREIARPYIEQVFAEPGQIPADIFEVLHQSFKESRSVFLGRLDFPTPAPNYARKLASLTAPTLVVWGARDALLPVTDAGRFAALIPAAQLVVYPQAGHVPHLEEPAAFTQDLLRFLGQ